MLEQPDDGPQELQEVFAAESGYFEAARGQIENRGAVLSGVSHDLGIPGTRLRQRTALISEAELRKKLKAEIDAMTGLIESVLTYTWAEMNAEEAIAQFADRGNRGNRGRISGHGQGLTIVDTIAKLRGGSLSFEDFAGGLRARRLIQRNKGGLSG